MNFNLKQLILIATLILTISCSKNKDNAEPKPSHTEILHHIAVTKKAVPVKITSNTDEGKFDFEITENANNIPYKVKNGFSFTATSNDVDNIMTIIITHNTTKSVIKSEQGKFFVKASSE